MPVMLIAALKKDVYRKPVTAMWDLLYEKVGSDIGRYIRASESLNLKYLL
jgi:hypothetical protein